jgi:hypothetical protein
MCRASFAAGLRGRIDCDEQRAARMWDGTPSLPAADSIEYQKPSFLLQRGGSQNSSFALKIRLMVADTLG